MSAKKKRALVKHKRRTPNPIAQILRDAEGAARDQIHQSIAAAVTHFGQKFAETLGAKWPLVDPPYTKPTPRRVINVTPPG